jgi:hypothetical protein
MPTTYSSLLLDLCLIGCNAQDAKELRREEVFSYEHTLDLPTLLRPMETRSFPSSGYYDYKFSISEIVSIRKTGRLSPAMRIYICALYVYCEAVEPHLRDDEEYLVLILDALLESGRLDMATAVSGFLVGINQHFVVTEMDIEFRRRLCGLFCRRLTTVGEQAEFRAEFEYLRSIANESSKLVDVQKWLMLNSRFPIPEGFATVDFVRLISPTNCD